jgi:PhoH-like ATPase
LKKNYVLDTNILLGSPNAVYGFEDNDVTVTVTTLQELDRKKTVPGDIGYHAREACRLIEELRTKGDLTHGVELPGGGTFRIAAMRSVAALPSGYSMDVPDNQIIATALAIQDAVKNKQHGKSGFEVFAHTDAERTILVTNDVSMRINASVCGLGENVEFYLNDHVSSEKEYTGRRDCTVTPQVINSLYKDSKVSLEDVNDANKFYGAPQVKAPVANEFFTFKSGTQSALAIYNVKDRSFHAIRDKSPFGITPKNAAQRFALYALTAPVEEIPFVILRGGAGTAKTFLSLAAGLDQAIDRESYDRVLITRNNVMADADFGYLPGDLDDKMTPLLMPFYDNLESLLRGHGDENERGRYGRSEDARQVQMQIDDLFETKVLDICPLAYMRGRSITHSFLIVDETQNATRSQIRDIITRAGVGTKVVICGDPVQIDAHNLDRWNNGLTFAAAKMKGSPLCAQVTFSDEESVRSDLAKEALKRLEL